MLHKTLTTPFCLSFFFFVLLPIIYKAESDEKFDISLTFNAKVQIPDPVCRNFFDHSEESAQEASVFKYFYYHHLRSTNVHYARFLDLIWVDFMDSSRPCVGVHKQ